jgi:putative iron-dependent peroxidase
VIEEAGKEIKIVRANMPFGSAGQGEFGTYFIGYARSPRTIEQMLTNMFIGRPPGNYDRLLDFSRAVTGNLFFVPSATFLDGVTSDQPAAGTPVAVEAPMEIPDLETSQLTPPARQGSLGIGSLKGDTQA